MKKGERKGKRGQLSRRGRTLNTKEERERENRGIEKT